MFHLPYYGRTDCSNCRLSASLDRQHSHYLPFLTESSSAHFHWLSHQSFSKLQILLQNESKRCLAKFKVVFQVLKSNQYGFPAVHLF